MVNAEEHRVQVQQRTEKDLGQIPEESTFYGRRGFTGGLVNGNGMRTRSVKKKKKEKQPG